MRKNPDHQQAHPTPASLDFRNFLKKAEAAAILACSIRKLDGLRQLGKLPAYKLGGTVRFKRNDVEHLIESSKVAVVALETDQK